MSKRSAVISDVRISQGSVETPLRWRWGKRFCNSYTYTYSFLKSVNKI